MGINKANKEVSVTDITAGEILLYGSTDGGTTWVPVVVDADGYLLSANLEHYKINNMDTGSDTKYYGYEDKAENWYIMKEVTSTGTYTYASGSSAYATAWTNRATQSYTIFSGAF